MRAQHTLHPLSAFPVYSCAFVSDDLLVAGGGGGASRSGIKNKLRLFRISDERQLDVLGELELDKDEDAPMSMAAHVEVLSRLKRIGTSSFMDVQSQTIVCGINSAVDKLEKGVNENCRKFSISGDEHKFALLATHGTLSPGNIEDYQRVTVLSPDAQIVAVGGEHDLTLLAYDGLSPISQSIRVPKGEIYDATLSASHLIIATNFNLLVYALPTSFRTGGKGKGKSEGEDEHAVPSDSTLPELRLVKTVDVPTISGIPTGATVTFRAARLHPFEAHVLYSVINVTLPRAPKAKTAKKQAYVLKWNISTSDDATFTTTLEASRKISEGNLTCFDVSRDGRLLALGISDYSLSVLDANTLAVRVFWQLCPSSKVLVSGGVDSSIRIIAMPDKFGGLPWSIIIFLLFAILAIALAAVWAK
ncbi:hypothetical protein ID866_1241 [Astraeus odoratus]|nr:hypothetical protein ID866_1241 [Astraeus odoratus]